MGGMTERNGDMDMMMKSALLNNVNNTDACADAMLGLACLDLAGLANLDGNFDLSGRNHGRVWYCRYAVDRA